MVDLLQKRAEVESELRGLRESRALALSRGRAVNNDRIIELEALLSGLADAEAAQAQADREIRRKEIEKARKELIDELNEDFPQWQDCLRSAEIAFREAVGAMLRAGEISERMRGNLTALLDEEGRKNIPLSEPDREMRWSGRIVAILAGLAAPATTYGNLSWHAGTGVFLSSDDWVSKETALLKPTIRTFLDGSSS